jgi:A/G-specific adenine glycosylase
MADNRKGRGIAKAPEFVDRLLDWFAQNGRHNLPWRQTRDPWLTLLAPVLLRKTTGQQVALVYTDFVSSYPNPEALGRATEAEVEAIIHPLGIEHHRATGMIALAKDIVKNHSGSVPSELDELKNLPLIGDYSAREVLCAAFGQDEAMMDRNMIRIMQRVFSLSSSKKRPHTDPRMWELANSILPKGRAREYNYAIMDFAHSVCKASNPLCPMCPMNDICDYARSAI